MFQHCALIRQLFPFFWELDLAHEKSKIGLDLTYIHLWNYNPARVGERIRVENFKIRALVHGCQKEFIPKKCKVKFNGYKG